MSFTQRLKFQTMWLSDIHLGSRWSAAMSHTNSLLKYLFARTTYLNGDTFDGRELAHHAYWPQSHERALQQLMHQPKEGSEVILIPGNHDIGLRRCLITEGVPLKDSRKHIAHQGLKLMQRALYYDGQGRHLVMHGDESETLAPTAQRLLAAYDTVYYGLSLMAPAFNRLAGPLLSRYVPLTQSFQNLVCRKIDFVSGFEQRVSDEARALDMDGVFTGHVHYPADKIISDPQGKTSYIRYRNSGSLQADVSCLVGTSRGGVQLLHWGDISRRLSADARQNAYILDELAEKTGAERLTDGSSFVFQPTSADVRARVVPSTQAELIAKATFGPVPKRYPVPAFA